VGWITKKTKKTGDGKGEGKKTCAKSKNQPSATFYLTRMGKTFQRLNRERGGTRTKPGMVESTRGKGERGGRGELRALRRHLDCKKLKVGKVTKHSLK